MKKFSTSLIFCLLIVLALTSCGRGASPAGGVPPSAPQTIAVTRTAQAEETRTPTQSAAVAQHTPLTTPIPQFFVDPAYYQGIIVITQYYTFLGHGLHKDAYQLLSGLEQGYTGGESNYLTMAQPSFKRVEIVSIEPFFLQVSHKFRTPTPEPADRKRFAVQIRAWGEGNMSGSRVNGALQDLFIELVLEAGAWKINSFATAP